MRRRARRVPVPRPTHAPIPAPVEVVAASSAADAPAETTRQIKRHGRLSATLVGLSLALLGAAFAAPLVRVVIAPKWFLTLVGSIALVFVFLLVVSFLRLRGLRRAVTEKLVDDSGPDAVVEGPGTEDKEAVQAPAASTGVAG